MNCEEFEMFWTRRRINNTLIAKNKTSKLIINSREKRYSCEVYFGGI